MKNWSTVFFFALMLLCGCSLEYHEKAEQLERELKISEEKRLKDIGSVPVSCIVELSEVKKVMV